MTTKPIIKRCCSTRKYFGSMAVFICGFILVTLLIWWFEK